YGTDVSIDLGDLSDVDKESSEADEASSAGLIGSLRADLRRPRTIGLAACVVFVVLCAASAVTAQPALEKVATVRVGLIDAALAVPAADRLLIPIPGATENVLHAYTLRSGTPVWQRAVAKGTGLDNGVDLELGNQGTVIVLPSLRVRDEDSTSRIQVLDVR